MSLFLYLDRDSPLHRLHPVVKVCGMLCLFVAAFVSDRPTVVLPVTAGVAGLIALVRAWANVRRLRVLFVMVFFMTLLIWSLFYRGGVSIAAWGPISVSAAGMRFALAMALKLVTFLGIGVVFLSTTKIEEFAYALTRVGMPYKVGFAMTMAFRLVPVFIDAAATVVQAQRCRGFNFDEGGVLQRMRRYVPVLVPVFMGALRRADGMAMALEARGFQSDRPRTSYEQYHFGIRDTLALMAAVASAGAYLALWHLGYTTAPIA